MSSLVPVMTPAPGQRLQRFAGDRIRFAVKDRAGRGVPQGWRARLRTNLGRADLLRREILEAHTRGLPLAGASWHDLAMPATGEEWSIDLPLIEPGYFKAKAYLLDPRGWQHWPEGPDVGISVHPDCYRTGNTIYCAFPRMFGASRSAPTTQDEKLARSLTLLDVAGYTIIPPSGKLRDLTQQLPHIIETLHCRILHLLPVNPTPTTYARFGRYGSPYAALDLATIDPALVVFDKRMTGIDQFRELTYAAHLRGARVFLDIVTNHTGWSSRLQETHPEWFVRHSDRSFASPGAWGVTWEDLVELRHQDVALWDELADTFLTWCRRGVDGFRCDAGYKVPMPAWQYLVARVQQEYPETIFLLEGLGGAWEATEVLLTEGGLHWAYSELFQNYSGAQVAGYLDHSLAQSRRVGLLVHYSETHDNDRLAARGRAWSLLRNRLCALASVSGGFGFTCGVEWLAAEKIKVHGSTGLNWGAAENLLPELSRLNQLLAQHPCFFDGAKLTRLTPLDSPIYALRRESEEGADVVLVLVNTDVETAATVVLDGNEVQGPNPALRTAQFEDCRNRDQEALAGAEPSRDPGLRTSVPAKEFSEWVDLLGQAAPRMKPEAGGRLSLSLAPGAAYCLAPTPRPVGLSGEDYRLARSRAAWALAALARVKPIERIGPVDWRALAREVDCSPAEFLTRASLPQRAIHLPQSPPLTEFSPQSPKGAPEPAPFPLVVTWTMLDLRRVTLVPPGHWLLVQDNAPFRASLSLNGNDSPPRQNAASVPVRAGHLACFPPRFAPSDAALQLERYADKDQHLSATIRFLAPEPDLGSAESSSKPRSELRSSARLRPSDLVLLTNGRGGMARICVDLGRVNSKYDCVLGANLHPAWPVDRHVFVKRIRVWINADGFISPLNFSSLISIAPGPPATWHFAANAGDGRSVEIVMAAEMVEGRNTTLFTFSRLPGKSRYGEPNEHPGGEPWEPRYPGAYNQPAGKPLPAEADVRLTVRLDIEDRNFHCETKRNGGAEHHFQTHVHTIATEMTRVEPDTPQRGSASATRPKSLRSFASTLLKRAARDPGFAPSPPGGVVGFAFTPAQDRHLRVYADHGSYHPQPEWSENIPHPVEQSRAQVGAGDAFSPGWFELPVPEEANVNLVVTADPDRAGPEPSTRPPGSAGRPAARIAPPPSRATPGGPRAPSFPDRLLQATLAFLVQRDSGKTIIAGYPWFLDWGRDTFICARGLLAAGLIAEVKELLVTFARFEKDGTLPNTIFGGNASNRDTSDAPLWFALVCEEVAQACRVGDSDADARKFYDTIVDDSHRTLRAVLESIFLNYARGTPNHIRMDPASALIWSPSHFTWMDTNYPACTPREGYPIEIQALWVRLLRHLDGIGARSAAEFGSDLADRALASLERLFWGETNGYHADVLLARPGQGAAEAIVDDALRSNYLLAISLGLVRGERAKRGVAAALRYLVVPGGLRSLAPLPVSVPLPNRAGDGRLLNNPLEPYWGVYEGDEDTRRKPAYHNGTAWTWTFPVFCEALARAWDFAPEAIAAAKAYLGSMARLMDEGCLGHIPEVLDADAPHALRGCDAQAWGATEALRVWKLLEAQDGT